MKIPSGNSFLNPQKILHHLGVKSGDRIADLGCGGAAYFVLQAAKMVGSRGVVYGLDVLKSALSGLKSRLELHNIDNVVPVWSDLEVYGAAKKIPDHSLDIALIINTLFQAHNRKGMLQEAVRMVAPHGRLVIIDWKTGGLSFGPSAGKLVSPHEVKDILSTYGCTLEEVFDPGQYHFGLTFRHTRKDG